MSRFLSFEPIVRGNSVQIPWEFVDFSTTAFIDISTDEVEVVFKEHVNAVSNLYSATVSDHYDGVNGKGQCDVDKSVTATFPEGYIHLECTWLPVDGRRITFFSGPVEIIEPASKPV